MRLNGLVTAFFTGLRSEKSEQDLSRGKAAPLSVRRGGGKTGPGYLISRRLIG